MEHLENDTRLVWVIHPDQKYVLVYHTPEPESLLRPQDALEGGAIVPGFSMSVAELFEEWVFSDRPQTLHHIQHHDLLLIQQQE